MLLPDQTILPPVPVPSSTKLSDDKDATTNGVVVTEFDVAAADVPMVLVAVTAKVYAVPGCRPSKLKVPPFACVNVLLIPLGFEVAVYEVIAEPPFEAGAAKLTVALRLPVAVATTVVGAFGTIIEGKTTEDVVVMELEGEEFVGPLPKPPEKATLTINVYAVAGLKPVTLIVPVREAEIAAGVIVAWKLPGEEIAVNDVYVTP